MADSIVHVDDRSNLLEAHNRGVFRDRGHASYPAIVVWRAPSSQTAYILDADNAGGNHAKFGGSVLDITDNYVRIGGGTATLDLLNGQSILFYNAANTNTANLKHSGTNDRLQTDDSFRSAVDLLAGQDALITRDVSAGRNLLLTGAGAFIRSDFSNATASNRAAFQSSTANGNTNVNVIPNGSGTIGGLFLANNSAPDSASKALLVRATASAVEILSLSNTGVFGPMNFYNSSAVGMVLDTSNNLTITGDLIVTGGVWTTFTPSVTQSAALTMTVNWARYRVLGKHATVQIKMTYSSGASVAGNAITITGLPAAIQPARTGAYAVAGTFVFFDSSASLAYTGFAETTTTTTVIGYRDAAAAVGAMGVVPAVAMAASDVVACQLTYEIA